MPAELRSPALWLPITTAGPISLAIGRWAYDLIATRIADDVEVTRHDVDGGQEVYVYRPPQPNGGALLWIHGGGTVQGRPENDHDLCSRLARDQGIVVVSTRYRLAPEHPFPAAHDDCFAALQWLHRSTDMLGIDPGRIAVGGASAGGGLAAGVVQRAHDEGVPVAFQLLLYPMLDDRTTTRPRSQRGRLVWTPDANVFGWAAYLGAAHASTDLPRYAAPGRRTDLAGLPPTWIGVGDLDLFYEEDTGYAQRLKAAGTAVDLRIEPGMYHAADYLKHTSPSMRAFRQSMFDAVGRGLGSPCS
ncbi:alpha/beta hydrolase [Nocardioides sp. Kera G14]|uniref:alpha/beta hydrolase n=1 Tax=Nocardioides sp. Kera G14 TaxID=2884264 RepID=UPI001D10A59E|nr:alpha/beta hydrolase [Nocardioides sp. Kera G14]UDY23547.1 alpha/beta hydrolase [Nocardioides sp. Kera G14]